MELELLPAVSLPLETLSVLIAPEEMLARALNGNPHMQQFRIVFVTGIRSGILSLLDRNSMELIVRRTFPPVQLRNYSGREPPILPGSGASGVERACHMAGRIAEAMKQASREATILLYVPTLDRHLEAMPWLPDIVCCFYDMRELGRDNSG